MTVPVTLCPTAGAFTQFFTTGGLPLNAGLLNTYVAGGTTPQATYTSSTGGTANANPIVLGADGRPPNEIWLLRGVAYRFDLTDSAASLIKTYDNIVASDIYLDQVQSWTVAQRGTPTALTSSGASIAVNLALANNFTHTMTESTTLAAPSNAVAGQAGILTITQHASSPKTLAYNAFWKFPAGVVPALTATNSAVDSFSYYIESAARATCVLVNDVK